MKLFTGSLKAVVKWGVGVDNVDFEACRLDKVSQHQICLDQKSQISQWVMLLSARNTFIIDIREGKWYSSQGMHLKAKVGLVGYGDIGKQLLKMFIEVSEMSISKERVLIQNQFSSHYNTLIK